MQTLANYLPELLFASIILMTLLLLAFWWGWNCGFKRSVELTEEIKITFKLGDEG